MLYNLRKSGFRGVTLYRLNCCYLRSVMEYCAVVYHSLLTLEQENDLEKLHRLAIRICHGFHIPVEETMAGEGIESLKACRLRGRDAFFLRWFPPREVRTGLRRPRQILESRSITLRRFNSPLESLRRRANELNVTTTVDPLVPADWDLVQEA